MLLRIVKSPRLVLLCLLLQACGQSGPPLVARDIVILEPLPGRQMSAGYLALTNNTDTDILITRVDSPEFARVEIHESTVEDGIARMRRLPELLIPANASVTLEQGGKHLMLMRPIDRPTAVTLSFYSDDTLLLSVEAPLTSRNN